MFNTLTTLSTLINVNHFKMTPLIAGVAPALPRIVNAFTDPWVGNWSDNTRSRFRRRPFILASVVPCAIFLPLLWRPFVVATLGSPGLLRE